MGKRSKLWIKMLAATTLLSAGLVWSGDTAYAAEGDVEINEENFPDSGFRDYISIFDQDGNGILSQDEISKTKEIDISVEKNWEFIEISSIEGIEYFSELESLNCHDVYKIKKFDLSKNEKLKWIDCVNLSDIESIDLSKNHNLEYLDCRSCYCLSNLNISNNPKMKYLDCEGCSDLCSLDLSDKVYLEYLGCGCTKLSSLDLTGNENLKKLYINDCTLLNELKLGKKPCLSVIMSSENRIKLLDLSGCNLYDSINQDDMLYDLDNTIKYYTFGGICLYCKQDMYIFTSKMLEGAESDVVINESNFPNENFRNYVKSFDIIERDGCLSIYELSLVKELEILDVESIRGVEFFYNLESLYVKNNELKEVDLSNIKKLKKLRLECNKIKNIDLSKNTELEELNCLGTKLTGLDVSNNKKLKNVSFWTYSGIVDLSNHPTLESVHQEGLTTYLNLEGDTSLTKIEFQDSDLAKINIKGCTSLKNLNFTGSALTELDLTGCEKIESLQLSMPKLQKLYAGPDSQLKEFTISDSEQLSCIDLSGSAKLESFSCAGCPLVEKLTISNEAPLREVICNNTILKELDLSPYSKLGTLNIYTNNALAKLSLPHQSQLGTVDIQGNGKLAVIQFPQSGKIENLVCKNNAIENADLSECNEVKKVDFNGNASLKSISLPVHIKSLVLGNNKSVSNIQFPQECKVSTISCNDTGMENIDLSECHELEKAEFMNNASLKSIVFPNSDYLETIKCNQNNLLQSIDVSKCKYLLELYCGENALQSLNLLDNINLRKLDCNNNQLKDLVMPRDLSYDILTSGGDTEKVKNNLVVNSLKDLNCSSNQLKNLELSDCEALTHLDCTMNQIKRIDISSCDELLKRVTGAKEEASGQVKYVDGIDGGYCLSCDSGVRVITHGKHGGNGVIYHAAVAATCETEGNSKYFECSCGLCFSDEACTKEIEDNSWIISAKGHRYGDAAYTWSADNEKVTAKRVCKNDASHTMTEKVKTTYEIIKKPTKTSTGTGRYTAVFTKEGFTTQTKDVQIEKLTPEDPPSKGDVTKNFTDVLEGEWYVPAVQFVYDRGIMNGVSGTSFGTKGTLTREQFITVLYNLEGKPEIAYKPIFDDVTDANSWFAKSVTWAAENAITSGVGGNKFGVGVEITREQLATLLYNYAQKKDEYKLSVDENAVTNFPDAGIIDSCASDGMKWAITNGVMSGKKGKDGQLFLDPLGKATRAECAQMIKNLKENAVK